MSKISKRMVIGVCVSIVVALITSFALINVSIESKSYGNQQISTFENSRYDFIVPAPGKEQIGELQGNKFISEVAAFYKLKTKIEGMSGAKYLTNIIMFDSFDNLDITMYNSQRLIEKSNATFENPIMLDYAAATALKLKVGDDVSANFGENGKKVTFKVSAIYQKNTQYDEGGVVTLFSGEQKAAYVKAPKYSGAFLKSNDADACFASLRTYKPLGIMRDRSEFTSDEQYKNYVDIFNGQNYSDEILKRTESLQQAKSLYSSYSSSALVKALFAGIIVLVGLVAVNIACFFFERKNIEVAITQGEKKGEISREYYLTSILDAVICFIVGTLVVALLKVPAYVSAGAYITSTLFAIVGVVLAVVVNITVVSVLLSKMYAKKPQKKSNKAGDKISNSMSAQELINYIDKISNGMSAQERINYIDKISNGLSAQERIINIDKISNGMSAQERINYIYKIRNGLSAQERIINIDKSSNGLSAQDIINYIYKISNGMSAQERINYIYKIRNGLSEQKRIYEECAKNKRVR